MRDLDDGDGFAPPALWVGGFVVLVGILLASVFFVGPREPLEPPFGRYLGCYSSPGAPDIRFDRFRVRIQQEPPIELSSKLTYHKGWSFEIERELGIDQMAHGRTKITLGRNNGEFIFLSREGEISASHPGFDLIDAKGLTSIHYSLSGATCSN